MKRTQLQIDTRRESCITDAQDMGMVDEWGELTAAGEAYVESAVQAYIEGED